MFVEKIVCSRCGKKYRPEDNPLLCLNNDFGRLDIYYDYDSVAESLSVGSLSVRRWNGVWRYWELMPVESVYASPLVEGGTPLMKCRRLGEHLGIPNLFIKDETRNPTHSFKDRAMAVGVSKAVEMKKTNVVTASSGNAAASLAAYSASVGIKCNAFVPEEISSGKAAQLLLYGARLVRVRQVAEGRDPTVEMMLETVKRLGWYPCPSFGPFNPYQVEGLKTIIYEVLEQLSWQPPTYIFIPTGSGCLGAGVWKGIHDLYTLGFIDSHPRMVPVQPEGNKALIDAILAGRKFEEIRTEKWPRSIASGLLDPFPWDGDAVMEGVRTTGGTGVAVDDARILDAVRLLAGLEGVFAEPSGAAGLAGLMKLLDEGVIDRGDTAVVLVTGSGLKEVEKLTSIYPEPPLIRPDITELEKLKLIS
jgi:threonine synthase